MILWSSPEDHASGLSEKINKLHSLGIIEQDIADSMHYIRKIRNRVMHNADGEAISEEEVMKVRHDIESVYSFAKSINK